MKTNYAVIDIETTSLNRYQGEITFIGVGVITHLYDAWDKSLPPMELKKMHIFSYEDGFKGFKELCDFLREYKYRLIYQNGTFDTLYIERHLGISLPIHEDIMLMGTAYDLAAEHGLKKMAQRYLGVEDWDIANKDKMSRDKAKVSPYLRKDVRYTYELFVYFQQHLRADQRALYKNLLLPAYLMYRKVERNGIYIDLDRLEEVRQAYAQKERKALKKLKALHDINWNSPIQVSKTLFEDAGLPQQKLSQKTGKPSADAKVLKKLALMGYELPTLLLDYKFYYGARTKFLASWPKYADENSRIHPHFNLTNVVTGRTSCSDPNLQQVPRSPELRTLFTAPPGRALIEADYSQLELRVAADYANDPTMIRIYKTGGDIHTETAMLVTGKSEITKEDRSRAKAINFGFLYGMQAKGFVEYAFNSYGVIFSLAEAQRYRELFFAKYSRLLPWHDEMAEICETLGGVETRFGRFRALPDIYSHEWGERNAAIRRAINTPVQGTGSDLLVLSAVQIVRDIPSAKVVGTIHDSILVECDEAEKDDVAARVKAIMERPQALKDFGVSFQIPLEADVGIGAWGMK